MNFVIRSVAAAALFCVAAFAQAEEGHLATVGMRARIDQLVLPGSELRARKLDDPSSPVVLRVLGTWPHGEFRRYDFEYVGLEPGIFDLGDFLERVDGSAVDDLPAIEVEILAVLRPGQVEPHPIQPGDLPRFGSYRALLWIAAVVWALGLCGLVWLVWSRRATAVEAAADAPPATLAERLRPRIEAAIDGRLDGAGKAELERLLLAHWRARLGLEQRSAADAITEIRRHPQAGELLGALEEWLHSPPSGGRHDVDVSALLAPYHGVDVEESA